MQLSLNNLSLCPMKKVLTFSNTVKHEISFQIFSMPFLYGSMYIGIVSSLIHLGPNYSPCSYLSSHNISRFFSWALAYLPWSFHWLCRFHCVAGLELNQFPVNWSRIESVPCEGSSKSFAALWVALAVKNPPANAGDVRDTGLIPGLGRLPGGGHSNPFQCLAWRIPWTEVPGGLQSIGSHRVGHNWSNLARRS